MMLVPVDVLNALINNPDCELLITVYKANVDVDDEYLIIIEDVVELLGQKSLPEVNVFVEVASVVICRLLIVVLVDMEVRMLLETVLLNVLELVDVKLKVVLDDLVDVFVLVYVIDKLLMAGRANVELSMPMNPLPLLYPA